MRLLDLGAAAACLAGEPVGVASVEPVGYERGEGPCDPNFCSERRAAPAPPGPTPLCADSRRSAALSSAVPFRRSLRLMTPLCASLRWPALRRAVLLEPSCAGWRRPRRSLDCVGRSACGAAAHLRSFPLRSIGRSGNSGSGRGTAQLMIQQGLLGCQSKRLVIGFGLGAGFCCRRMRCCLRRRTCRRSGKRTSPTASTSTLSARRSPRGPGSNQRCKHDTCVKYC